MMYKTVNEHVDSCACGAVPSFQQRIIFKTAVLVFLMHSRYCAGVSGRLLQVHDNELRLFRQLLSVVSSLHEFQRHCWWC